MTTIRAELWSAFPCVPGARMIGDLTLCDTGNTWSEQVDGSDSCALRVMADPRVTPTVLSVVRILADDGRVWEYRVSEVGETNDRSVVPVRGVSPLLSLADAGPSLSVVGGRAVYGVAAFDTAANLLTTHVFSRLTEHGLTWWSIGTVTATTEPRVVQAPNTGWTRLQWARAIADAFGLELRARRVGTSGYVLDAVTRIGAGARPVFVARGHNLLSQEATRDDSELATAVTILGPVPDGDTVPSGIGENAWVLGTIPGSAPFWIALTDPLGGDAPVAFNNQLVGAYLLRGDGGTTEILETRASDSAVRVGATSGLVAGEHVQIVANAAARRLDELTVPGVPRLHRSETQQTGNHGRNLLRRGLLHDWSALTACTGWTAQGGAFDVGRYRRDTPQTVTFQVNGTLAAGSSSVPFKGAPANARFYVAEAIQLVRTVAPIQSEIRVLTGLVVEADGAGNGTLTISGTLTNTYHDGATITVVTSPSAWPIRPLPVIFPAEPTCPDDVMRFLTQNTGTLPPAATAVRLQSDPFTVKYVAGDLAQVTVEAAFTLHNGNPQARGNLDSGSLVTDDPQQVVTRQLPGVMLRNNTTGTRLAYSFVAPSVPAFASVNAFAACTATLTADTTLDVCLLSGITGVLFIACRYVVVWLGSAETMVPVRGSWDNARWQRANATLRARRYGAAAMRLSLADLSAFAGYSVTREQLTLGGDIVLTDAGVTLRLLGLVFAQGAMHAPEVLVDARPTRLTRLLTETPR